MKNKNDLMPSADSATEELFERVAQIIESARLSVVHTVNQELVQAYWAIGREIVLELQEGEARAAYGKQVIRRLSEQLTERFGKGFSVLNLQLFRQFYLAYSGTDQIYYTACNKLKIKPETENGPRTQSGFQFHPQLSWSHYRILMRVEKLEARAFYEKEAGENGWSLRQLERQVGSLFYERLLKSRDKTGMLTKANSEANQTLWHLKHRYTCLKKQKVVKNKSSRPFWYLKNNIFFGDPEGSRTPVSRVRVWCPRPLNDGVTHNKMATT